MIILESLAKKHIDYWSKVDKKKLSKIQELLHSIKHTPTEGIGKPERMRGFKKNIWSRRIDNEHRLVYEVLHDQTIILSARYHYRKKSD
jgi:toxin YoeB